jgi:hypothetical protein
MRKLLIPTYDVSETLNVISWFPRKFGLAYDVAPIAVGDAYHEGDAMVVPVESDDATIALLADVLDIELDY